MTQIAQTDPALLAQQAAQQQNASQNAPTTQSENSGGASGQAETRLADDFDTFLTLLTSQLQNQDPLEPLDSNEFVNQLVQFSSVEQLIASNQSMEALLDLQTSNTQLSAVDFIGKQATVASQEARLKDGEASWTYTLPQNADRSDLIVRDANGQAVFTAKGETGEGAHDFVWNGEDDAGNALPGGEYTLNVVAKDAEGEDISAQVRTTGRVTGVDLSGEEAVIEMGGLTVPASSIISVRELAGEQTS